MIRSLFLGLLFCLFGLYISQAQSIITDLDVFLLESDDNYPMIDNITPKGAADKAGLKAGDIILTIDLESAKDMGLIKVYGLFKGKWRSSVRLDVKRGDTEMVFRVIRTGIELPNGTWCLEGNCRNGKGAIGYEDGSTFVGEFENGKRFGKGVYTSGDLRIQSSFWKEQADYPIHGIISFENGMVYNGDFLQSTLLPQGQGTMYKDNKALYGGLREYDQGVLVVQEQSANEEVGGNPEEFKEALAFWQKELGLVKSGTASGEFDFNRFQASSITIAQQYKALEEVYLIALRKHNECYDSPSSDRFSIQHFRQCQKQFLSGISKLKDYSEKFRALFDESQAELKKAGCGIDDIHYKFNLYGSSMSVIDNGFKKLYDNSYILLSQLNAIDSDKDARTLFKSNAASMDKIYKEISDSIDRYGVFYDKWARRIKEDCR